MAVKKKYQMAPKEKKFSIIGFVFFGIAILLMIPITIGVGIIPFMIVAFICLGIAMALIVKGKNEHKKWVAEGNVEYRYYDAETGQEVDANGNPIDPNAVPKPKAEPEPKFDEPAPVQSGGETHQEKPAPQKQPETIRGADLTIFGKLLPAAGLGLLALAFLLRTIMFIRELVPYAKNGGTFWGSYILYAIRIIGPAILLAISVVALVKFFANKQTINKGYKAMLSLAVWYAVLNIVGLTYVISSLGVLIYDFVDLAIKNSGISDIFVEMLIDNIVIDVFYIAFAIALIIFTKIALKNNVDSMKNKVFAMLPFGIIVLTEIIFMIITGATLPEGYVAPGYFVTAFIILLGAGSLGAIPFLVKFEKDDGGNLTATSAIATAPVAAAPVYKEPQDLEEPKEVKPNKKNDGDPEVKSSKKGLIIILIAVIAFVLVGGGVTAAILLTNKNNREKGPDDNPSSYVAPSTKSSSSSSSSKSSSKSSSSSSVVSKTPKEVMADIVTNIFGSAKYYDDNNSDYNYWYGDSGFATIVSFEGTFDESYLDQAVLYVVDKLPPYLRNIDEIHSVTWGDGTNGSIQNFVSQDEQVKVELGSYIEDGILSCQVISHFNF